MNRLSTLLKKQISTETHNLILSAQDNLITDLTREIELQKRRYEDDVNFRISNERDLETLKKENEKLKIKIDQENAILLSRRKDPAIKAKINQLKEQNLKMKSQIESSQTKFKYLMEQLVDIKAKLVNQERIKEEFMEKINKYQADMEEKVSLEQKIAHTQESIDKLLIFQDKLKKNIAKYGGDSSQNKLIIMKNLSMMIIEMNQYERITIVLQEEYMATGLTLYALLDDARKLIARNNLVNDKLPHTMGILKNEYILKIINQYAQLDLTKSEDDQIEFSKMSVTYFFRVFMCEVKIQDIIENLEILVKDYDQRKAQFLQYKHLMIDQEFSDITEDEIRDALKYNEDLKSKMIYFQAQTKEYNEVIGIQRRGIDRFQEKIRLKLTAEVKERQKLSEILCKDGISRVQIVNSTLYQFYLDADQLMKFQWLSHKKNEFLNFTRQVISLSNENNDLTANFQILKLVMDKMKKLAANINSQDIQKIDKIIKKLNLFLESLFRDHDVLVDIERRVRELKLSLDLIIKVVQDETNKIVLQNLDKKTDQSKELFIKDDKLMKFLDEKKGYIYHVKAQIEDDDIELQNKFQIFELLLGEANIEEERANEQQVQIQSKTDRLRRQFQKQTPINFADIDDYNDIILSLQGLQTHITATEQKIEDAYKKIKDLDIPLKEIETMIKIRRKENTDKSIQLSFASMDRLIKLLQRLTSEMDAVIEDQQRLINNGFDDQEKTKDTISFQKEIEYKYEYLREYQKRKDEYQIHLNVIKKEFQEKESMKDSQIGAEFIKIKSDNDKLKSQIIQTIATLESQINDDVKGCQNSNQILQQKYLTKEERYKMSYQMREVKAEEFRSWQIKLKEMEERQLRLENALRKLGFSKQSEKTYKLYVTKVQEARSKTSDFEIQVEDNSKVLINEASDIDYITTRIVKTTRIDEIYQLLKQMKVTVESFSDDIEDQEEKLEQLEKETEDFIEQVRDEVYTETENKNLKLNNSIEKLNTKIVEVQDEMKNFFEEFKENIKELKNQEQIQKIIAELKEEMVKVTDMRDQIDRDIVILKQNVVKLDKKTFAINDCVVIQNESAQLDVQANQDFDEAVEVQIKLRKIIQQFKSLNADEQERKLRLQRLKQLIKDNKELLRQMKQHNGQNLDKCNDFDILYKAMLGSEDYSYKQQKIAKKLQKIILIKDDTAKYTKLREDLEAQLAKYTDQMLDEIVELEMLDNLYDKNDKINQSVRGYIKILNEINKGLDKRRIKTMDAEIRKNVAKHNQELEGLGNAFHEQMKQVDIFGQKIKGVQDVNQRAELHKTLTSFQTELNNFKLKYDLVSTELKNFQEEIKPKDLEYQETVVVLAQYIERLKKIYEELKILKMTIDKLALDIAAELANLSSKDLEQKLRDLISQLLKAQQLNQVTGDHITRVINLTDSYDGYTSGGDDTKFYTGMNTGSKKLYEEFNGSNKHFSQLVNQIEQFIVEVKSKGDKKDSETTKYINKEVLKLEDLVSKALTNRQGIDTQAISNKGKMSDWILEEKIQRRKKETEEIDIQNQEQMNYSEEMRQKIQSELELCGGEDFFKAYVDKLRNSLIELDQLLLQVEPLQKKNKNIGIDCDQLYNEVITYKDPETKVMQRLDWFDQHLLIKKRVGDMRKEFQTSFWNINRNLLDKINGIIAKKPVRQLFKMNAQDEVDRMLFEMLNRLGIPIPIERLGGGYYMFGTKKIFCKIINGKLVVRVGGGYMGIEEFIMTYGKQEVDKVKAAKDLEEQVKAKQNGGSFIGVSMLKDTGSPRQSDGTPMATPKTGTAKNGGGTTKSTFSQATKKK